MHLGGRGNADAEGAVENAVVSFELDALQLILGMLREDQGDFLQHTWTINAFHVNCCFVKVNRRTRVVPHGGYNIIAKARFMFECYATISTMDFEMMIIIDVAHHLIPLDGATMWTDFAMVDDFVRERKRGFSIQLFHKICIQCRLSF